MRSIRTAIRYPARDLRRLESGPVLTAHTEQLSAVFPNLILNGTNYQR